MAVKNIIKTIEENYFKGSQSINYKCILRFNGKKLMIEIKKDSYDAQSYARVSIWSDASLTWNFLDNIPYSQMKLVTDNVSYVRGTEDLKVKTAVTFDKNELIKKASNILN
jgi:hypothetical protein